MYEYMGSTFENSGFWFLIRGFWLYVYKSGIYGIAFGFLIYFYLKRKDHIANEWIYPIFLALITIFNPFLMTLICYLLDRFNILTGVALSGTFTRIFILFPFHFIIAIAALSMLDKVKEKTKRILIILLLFISIAIVGDSTLFKSYKTLENIYGIPKEVIEICEQLHTDAKSNIVNTLVLHYKYRAYIRQYDAGIMIPGTHMDILNIETMTDVNNLNWEYDYIVVPKESNINYELTEYEVDKISETDSCNIYKKLGAEE